MANEDKHTEQFEELCTAYVLNALESEEHETFLRMLEQANEEEIELYRQLRSTATQLSFTIDKIEPSAAVKERIMAQIGSEEDTATGEADPNVTSIDAEKEKSGGFSRGALAMAASFALLLVALSLVFYSFNLSSQLDNKEGIIQNQQAKITELQSEVQRKEELLSILESRDVDLVMMAGLEVNPNGYGKVIWDADKNQALLQVSNLPSVPKDKDYQLWIIKNNQPVSAGVFAVNDPSKDSFFKIEKMADADKQSANAFAVTLEPKGGAKQPTGDMYLLGNRDSEEN